MAQSWLILELGGSQFWVGAANGLRVIPALFLSVVAGVLIDRVGGRKILLWDRTILLLLAAATAGLVLTDVAEVWHVVAISILAGAAIALGMPSTQTLMVELVPEDGLQAANSLNSFSFSAARALGPMAAGLLIAWFGLGAPWLALTVLYAFTLACTFRLPRVQPPKTVGRTPLQNLTDGLKYVRTHPVLSRIMLLAFTVLCASTVMPIWPIYARDRFAVGETGFGIMMAVFAAGQGLSALYVSLRGGWQRRAVPILSSSLVWSGTMILFGFSHSYALSLVALFFMGMAITPWVTSISTTLQTKTEKSMLGRVMAIYSISLQVGFMGWLLGGWLGELIGNEWMLLGTGSAFTILHFLVFATSKPLRQI